MQLETGSQSNASPLSKASHINFRDLFRNKNKLFKKMEDLENRYVQSNISYYFDDDFFSFEKFFDQQTDVRPIRSVHDQDSHSSKVSDKNYSKDYRKRKTVYIQFLEKKIIQLMDHIYFMSKVQAESAKSCFSVLINIQQQFESEKLKLYEYCESLHKSFDSLLHEDYARNFINFFGEQNKRRKKIVQKSLKNVADFATPRLLYFLSNTQNYSTKDELILLDTHIQLDKFDLKREVRQQKQNYDNILWEISMISDKIVNQITDFDSLIKKILKQTKIQSEHVFTKIAEIENSTNSLVECPFVDEHTKSIIKFI